MTKSLGVVVKVRNLEQFQTWLMEHQCLKQTLVTEEQNMGTALDARLVVTLRCDRTTDLSKVIQETGLVDSVARVDRNFVSSVPKTRR